MELKHGRDMKLGRNQGNAEERRYREGRNYMTH
jgi:hypothetical protein